MSIIIIIHINYDSNCYFCLFICSVRIVSVKYIYKVLYTLINTLDNYDNSGLGLKVLGNPKKDNYVILIWLA